MLTSSHIDDDFEAFQSALYAASVARVKVVVGDSDQPVHANGPEQDASEIEVDEVRCNKSTLTQNSDS